MAKYRTKILECYSCTVDCMPWMQVPDGSTRLSRTRENFGRVCEGWDEAKTDLGQLKIFINNFDNPEYGASSQPYPKAPYPDEW